MLTKRIAAAGNEVAHVHKQTGTKVSWFRFSIRPEPLGVWSPLTETRWLWGRDWVSPYSGTSIKGTPSGQREVSL